MRILLKRKGALGDVLEVTAITHRLRNENPDALIAVQTDYPQIFEGNTDVNACGPTVDHSEWDRVIDLDMAFENRLRKLSGIDAYSEVTFDDRLTSKRLHFSWDRMAAHEPGKYVVLHAARSWPIRTLPREFWQALIDELAKRDYRVILTGTSQDWDNLERAFDLRDKLSLKQQVGLIDMACCFVCSESGPMVFAQLTRTPIIALLTMIPPKFVTYERYGILGWRFYPIRAAVNCVGCATDQPEPTTFFDCKHVPTSWGYRRCLTEFYPIEIANKVDEVHVMRTE